MIRLKNGPVEGSVLHLRSAPKLLRVVIDSAGKVDALDQPGDEPFDNETVHVYKRVTDVATGFACSRGKGCSLIVSADYEFVEDRPEREILRDNEKWMKWCEAQELSEKEKP